MFMLMSGGSEGAFGVSAYAATFESELSSDCLTVTTTLWRGSRS